MAADLPTDRPHPFTLFGRQLVLWRDAAGAWRCFQDACPHRLAPLSEGRVVEGQLVCSYHGWSFEGTGKCTRVPQVGAERLPGSCCRGPCRLRVARPAEPAGQLCRHCPVLRAVLARALNGSLPLRPWGHQQLCVQAMDERSEAAACGSRRACAATQPTAEAAGLVWVWPDASPGAPEQAAAAPLPVHPDLLAGGAGGGATPGSGSFVNIGGGWLVRECPYGFDTMIENILVGTGASGAELHRAPPALPPRSHAQPLLPLTLPQDPGA